MSFIDEEVIKDAGFQRREIEVNWHGHQDRGLGVAIISQPLNQGQMLFMVLRLELVREPNAPLDQTLVNLSLRCKR